MKPLSQLLQLFNCISLVFSKISEILQEYFLFANCKFKLDTQR